jgi:hypothetical protein
VKLHHAGAVENLVKARDSVNILLQNHALLIFGEFLSILQE